MSVDILSWLDNSEPVKSEVIGRKAATDTLTSSDIKGTTFEVSREVLLHLLEKAIVVVPTKDIIPAFTNFKFRVDSELLTISATNGEVSIEVWTDQVKGLVSGVEYYPARSLMAIVREALPGSTIYVESTPQGVVIVAGNFSSELEILTNPDFELPYKSGQYDSYAINRLQFIEAINAVKYALPKKEFNGQDSLKMISIKNGKFTVCDGSRFQQVRIDGFNLNMQLNADVISTLIKVLHFTDDEEVAVSETDTDLLFQVGMLNFFTKKVTKVYPNVEQLWLRPALTNDQAFLVDRDELITAIKQVKTSADLTSNAVLLEIDSSEVVVSIKGINKSATTTIACKLEGKPRKLVVNYLHLAEMLKAYNQKECRFLLGPDSRGKKTPVLLKDDETMALATISQLVAYRAGI